MHAARRREVAVARYRTGAHGNSVPARWYGYDVKGDRVRLLDGVPTTPCAPDVVLTWRTRIVYGLSCS
jgi:hypothetical protein